MKSAYQRTLTLIAASTLALAAGASLAGPSSQGGQYYDRARVISSTPVYEEMNTPRQDCWTERVRDTHASDRSYGGAIIGGLVGGILGNQVGKGNGRKLATVVGATTGAIVGDRSDNRDPGWSGSREVERCRTVDHWSRQQVGYDVVYRYQGREYTTFLPYDPGPDLRLKVNFSVAER